MSLLKMVVIVSMPRSCADLSEAVIAGAGRRIGGAVASTSSVRHAGRRSATARDDEIVPSLTRSAQMTPIATADGPPKIALADAVVMVVIQRETCGSIPFGRRSLISRRNAATTGAETCGSSWTAASSTTWPQLSNA